MSDIEPTERNSWLPVDLTPYLDGKETPGPTLLARTDNKLLLYAGRTHAIAGPPASGKTWFALLAVQQAITAGHKALYLDFEDNPAGISNRLSAMGVPKETIQENLTYSWPDQPLKNKDGRWTNFGLEFLQHIDSNEWAVVVIDGVTEAMSLEGLELNSNSDVATWQQLLPKRLAATGSAVLMIDHVTKSVEGRHGPIGGQHKLAGLTGVQYMATVDKPFTRAISEEVEGVLRIGIGKDREGHVQRHAIAGVIGHLTLTAYPDGGVRLDLVPPGDKVASFDTQLAGKIADYLQTYEKSSKNAVEKGVEGKTDNIRRTLREMAEKGFVDIELSGGWHRHTLTTEGYEVLCG